MSDYADDEAVTLMSGTSYIALRLWWIAHKKTWWHRIASIASYVSFKRPRLERFGDTHRFTCFCGKRWYERHMP